MSLSTRLLTSALVVSGIVGVADAAGAQDADGNDFFDFRAALVPIGGVASTDSVIDQSVDPATDRADVFRLLTRGYDRLVVVLVPDEPLRRAATLALHDAEGALVAPGDGEAFDTIRHPLPSGSSEWFFRVSVAEGADAPVGYDLWVMLDTDDRFDAERSRRGALWNRRVIAPGETWESTTVGLDGTHTFLDLLVPTELTFVLEWDNDPDEDCDAEVDLDLYLYDRPAGDELDADLRGEDFMPAAISRALPPGRYFVRVEPPGDVDVPFVLRVEEGAGSLPPPRVAPGCAPLDAGPPIDPIVPGDDAGRTSPPPSSDSGGGGCSVARSPGAGISYWLAPALLAALAVVVRRSRAARDTTRRLAA